MMMPCPSPVPRPGLLSAALVLAMLPVLTFGLLAGGALWAMRRFAGPAPGRPGSPAPPGEPGIDAGEGI